MTCGGWSLVGIASNPVHPGRVGVVIVVGGPQYRVGSHRQFVLLARALAGNGYPVLRFDYRGMGDSDGDAPGFESVDDDIAVAVDALRREQPSVERIVLWGLCDGASAALLYCGKRNDARIAGLCLLNPWVRSDTTLARTQLKHYYGARLVQKAFWAKFLTGHLNWRASLKAFFGSLIKSRQINRPTASKLPFQQKMALALRNFSGAVLLIVSGSDYTAKEFLESVASDAYWAGLMEKRGLTRLDFADADHTFSNAQRRAAVEQSMLQWLGTLTLQ